MIFSFEQEHSNIITFVPTKGPTSGGTQITLIGNFSGIEELLCSFGGIDVVAKVSSDGFLAHCKSPAVPSVGFIHFGLFATPQFLSQFPSNSFLYEEELQNH